MRHGLVAVRARLVFDPGPLLHRPRGKADLPAFPGNRDKDSALVTGFIEPGDRSGRADPPFGREPVGIKAAALEVTRMRGPQPAGIRWPPIAREPYQVVGRTRLGRRRRAGPA